MYTILFIKKKNSCDIRPLERPKRVALALFTILFKRIIGKKRTRAIVYFLLYNQRALPIGRAPFFFSAALHCTYYFKSTRSRAFQMLWASHSRAFFLKASNISIRYFIIIYYIQKKKKLKKKSENLQENDAREAAERNETKRNETKRKARH